ncbi:MAG: YeeE/YedE thiosulfate transporter family protein [Pseudomonadota bacterium]
MIPDAWIWGLCGGLMIGCAAALYLLVNGRVMGASGILGGLVEGRRDWAERAAFIAGLVGVPALASLGTPAMTGATGNIAVLIAGGLLVGFGTRLGNGCTSGHGVCGMSRFSVRGIVAVVTFLVAGVLAMAVLRHGLGWI